MIRDYETMIQKKIEKSFDILLPICGIIAWSVGYLGYLLLGDYTNLIIDIILGFFYVLIFLSRKSIPIDMKIMLAVLVTLGSGFFFLIKSGLVGTGFIMFILGNSVSVIYLSTRRSQLISVLSIVSIVAVWLSHNLLPDIFPGNDGDILWTIHVILFVLLMIIINTATTSIRTYLLESVSKLEGSVDKVYDLAYYDQLTGLPNRNMFNELLVERSKIHNINGYLVLFDLKDFKLINSIYGNDLGDEVLIKVAQIFTSLKSKNDIVSRISGNEYGWWIESLSQESLKQKLLYYKEAFYRELSIQGITRRIDFNIGYAHFPSQGTTIDLCYQKGTLALDVAKNHPHLNMVAYDDHLDYRARYEEKVKDMLSTAVRNNVFTLNYQTKVNVKSDKIVGVEALARWETQEFGFISPSYFIPLIEKLNLSVVFGNMIIGKVLDDYPALCSKYHKDIKVSINISPTHIFNQGFKVFLLEALIIRGIDPSAIILEITEEVMIEDFQLISDIIKPLRNLGIGISLDDFGTGYSSFNYLAQMELDELKIDKAFIDQIHEGEKVNAILTSIIQLAEVYGVHIVAEGVETKNQKDLLMELGCHMIQGYYYSKPLPIKSDL